MSIRKERLTDNFSCTDSAGKVYTVHEYTGYFIEESIGSESVELEGLKRYQLENGDIVNREADGSFGIFEPFSGATIKLLRQ